MSVIDMRNLRPGELVVIGRKIYGRCGICRQIVRVDKPILGSMHICA